MLRSFAKPEVASQNDASSHVDWLNGLTDRFDGLFRFIVNLGYSTDHSNIVYNNYCLHYGKSVVAVTLSPFIYIKHAIHANKTHAIMRIQII